MKIGNEVSGMHLMKHLDLAPDYIYGSESRAHSFGHFEKCVLFNSRTYTSRLKSAGSEKRGV
jgi:hypothetical protein